MTFFILDQGHRIETPMSSVFRREGVAAVTKSAAVVNDPGHSPTPTRSAAPTPDNPYAKNLDTENEARKPVRYAHEIMHKPVLTLAENATLETARSIFKRHKFRHIPVVNGEGTLTGMLSDRSFLVDAVYQRFVSGALGPEDTVNSIMSTKVLSATADTAVRELAGVMSAERIGALPIVDAHNAVSGIVTRSDILRTLLNQAPLELWT